MSKLELFKSKQNTLTKTNKKEPALNTGLNVTAITGILYIVTWIFPDLLPEKVQQAIIVIGALLLPFITALLVRRKVWSPESVQEVLEEGVSAALEEKEKFDKAEKIALMKQNIKSPKLL